MQGLPVEYENFESKQEARDFINTLDSVFDPRFLEALAFFNKNKTIRFECQNFWLEMNLTVRFDKGLGVKVTCIYPNVNSEGNLKHAVNIIMEYYVMDYSEGKNPIDYSNVDKILDLIEVDE